MYNTADQCREMGLTVGDTIVRRQTYFSEEWSESELTVIFLGLQVAVFSERSRSSNAPRWRSKGESSNWTLDCHDWKIIKPQKDMAMKQPSDEAMPVVGSLKLSADGLRPNTAHWLALVNSHDVPELFETPVVRLSDALVMFVAKDAEIAALTAEVDRLKTVIKQTLDALAKFNYEEGVVGGWAGYENGHGQEVGTELDAAIAAMTQETK